MDEKKFYLKERHIRPIYEDEEMQTLVISLILCLLLKPERGTLDELYCRQFPFLEGKQNVLYLLHYHLNNASNENVIPKLLERVKHIHPPLVGQRLLKLLCGQLFDLRTYSNGQDWEKIATGAYGTVYEVETQLSEPRVVAIKQMDFPSSIYERCVLHDIFTEITSLEEFRLQKCITDLYDYGYSNGCYYIVMKKYATCLRTWRLS
jgi:hypothetical protein